MVWQSARVFNSVVCPVRGILTLVTARPIGVFILKLIPKNWHKHQHYKDRTPPWIKLHREILNDREFMCLPIASKALAPLMWLLASETKDGVFDASTEELSFRLRFTQKEIEFGIKPLIDKGFFIRAIDLLADCNQDARPEGEREVEGEAETEGDTQSKSAKKITLDVFVKQRIDDGLTPIAETDPVWKVIDKLEMPDDFAELQWRYLEQQYSVKKGGRAKRYEEWPLVLAKALRELWGQLFFKHETQGWILTSKGKNLKELAA